MAEIRVTGGELGGRRLHVPRRGVRPTTGRVREAIFSMLGSSVEGARVLDLFAGTGALAIEALSRGAAQATLVDTKPEAARRNLESLGLNDRSAVLRSDVARYLRRAGPGSFDLVLCDPPYRLADRLAAELDPLIRAALADGGMVMAETSPEHPLRLQLPLIKEGAYGDTLIQIRGTR
jgi:16S rRNA (guanine966-N2)-methyltransferase